MKKRTGSSIDDETIALTCVHRTSPRGPSAACMFHSLIADVGLPVLCIQCLWVRGAGGWALEFTAFFQGRGYCSAVLLGGLLGDGERRVLHGGAAWFFGDSRSQSGRSRASA